MLVRPLYGYILWLLFFCLSLTANVASGLTTPWLNNPQQPNAEVRFLVTGETDQKNNTVTAALEIRLADDWKTYWRSPGEGGIAPAIKWNDSENLKQVLWHWPVPQRFELLGINTLGYKNDVIIPLTLEVDDLNSPVSLRGKLRLPACTTICVLTDYEINLDFTPSQLKPDTEAIYLTDKALSSVPKLMPYTGLKAEAAYWNGNSKEIVVNAISKKGWSSPDVVLDGVKDITFGLPEIIIRDEQLQARIKASSLYGDFDLTDQSITVTLLDGKNARRADETVLKVVKGSPEVLIGQTIPQLLMMIGFALLGGLILNLMPCVLPVLGLKLSSVISTSGQNALLTRKQFLSSAAGIIFSFWLLAGFIWLLKFTGQSVGWGIQFQSAGFIMFMVLVTALFGANLLGLFEIRLPSSLSTKLASTGDNSTAGHFVQGVFATLLATPCSAPFLGTAVAFALSGGTLSLLSIFTALGIGMSAPYLLVAVKPSLLRWLPKPGLWMVKLRSVLAILLLITTLWLTSLLMAHLSTVWVMALAIMPVLIMVYWLLSLILPDAGKTLRLIPAVFLSLALVTSGAWLLGTFEKSEIALTLPWQPLDEASIPKLVASGKTVFVDVTADWCVTCKANKVGVIDRDPVNSRLQGQEIILMKGDWTRPSEEISAYLQKKRSIWCAF